MLNKLIRVQKIIAVALMVTVASFSSLMTSTAMAQTMPKLAGELSTRGQVTLNGMTAGSGATIFSGSSLKTGNKGAATINLGRMGQVELSADSELVLKIDNGLIGGELRAGRLIVSAPAGVGINITTAEGLAVADGREASVLTVDVACGNTRVASAKSDAKVTSGSRVEVVSAGQEVAVGQQGPADASRCPRMAAAAAKVGQTISGAALAGLIILGLGGGIAGIIGATQGDNINSSVLGTLSAFRL